MLIKNAFNRLNFICITTSENGPPVTSLTANQSVYTSSSNILNYSFCLYFINSSNFFLSKILKSKLNPLLHHAKVQTLLKEAYMMKSNKVCFSINRYLLQSSYLVIARQIALQVNFPVYDHMKI